MTQEAPPAASDGVAQRPVAPRLFANRNYTLLLSGQTISQVGNALFPLAVYWWTFSLTHSSVDLGYIATAEGLTALAGIFAGVLVDRSDRRWTMIWADVARLVLTGVLGLAALTGRLSFASILVFVLLLGLVQNLFSPAQAALLPSVVEPSELDAALCSGSSGRRSSYYWTPQVSSSADSSDRHAGAPAKERPASGPDLPAARSGAHRPSPSAKGGVRDHVHVLVHVGPAQ